jgi:hypothetical protein
MRWQVLVWLDDFGNRWAYLGGQFWFVDSGGMHISATWARGSKA